MRLRAYLVDDEPLAIERLSRLLERTDRVEIVGAATDPAPALEYLRNHPVDVLFLDIQMPGLSGFDVLARLEHQPVVIFTTAYGHYALEAFQADSADYLLKPVDAVKLDWALDKAMRLAGQPASSDWRALLEVLRREREQPERIAVRLGERVTFLDLTSITHFRAEDKLTFAMAGGKTYAIDHSIAELERRLDQRRFVRIHRATLVNAAWVREITPGFAGGLLIRLGDPEATTLSVARNRARDVRSRLGF